MKSCLFVVLMVFVASCAIGAPDAWRVKVVDYAPSSPEASTLTAQSRWPTADRESWSSAGGTFSLWTEIYSGGFRVKTAVCSYTASTGALTFGTVSAVTVDGAGDNISHAIAKKVGSSYKMWFWNRGWTGQSTLYTTSTDGVNWAAATATTVYGPTSQATGTYGHGGSYLSSSGVYLNTQISDSGTASMCVTTSGDGTTIWYDIDTGDGVGNGIPNPIAIKDSTVSGVDPTGGLARDCAGTLIAVINPVNDKGNGLVVANASELEGGDGYQWVCDPDSDSTAGLKPALTSIIGVNSLSGPSLRRTQKEATIISHSANQYDPATKFLIVYCAYWDTDSNGSTDTNGLGHAVLSMTRNNADLNYDGTVNSNDIGPFSAAYGSTSGLNGNYNADADFNADGKVNANDIGPFSVRYGSNCSYGQ